jgi:hypothetical protein
MKKKKLKLRITLMALMLIAAWIATIDVKGQSTCSDAVTKEQDTSYNYTTYSITSTAFWVKFTALYQNCQVKLQQSISTPNAAITGIYLYSGSCSSLVEMKHVLTTSYDSLIINTTGLSVGNNYYIKVIQNQSNQGYFDLCINNKVLSGYDTMPIFNCNGICHNLIYNGDFSLGNTGFTTTYTLDPTPTDGSSIPGYYNITTNADIEHQGWYGYGHGGSGNFLIVDEDDLSTSLCDSVMWKQTVNVQSNKNYRLNFWISELDEDDTWSGAAIKSYINGVAIVFHPVNLTPRTIVTAPVDPTYPDTWIPVCAVWNSGSATTATIELDEGRPRKTGLLGSDIGIDDIAFGLDASVEAGNNQAICLGQCATLTATGDSTYLWSNGSTTSTIVVCPTTTTTYTVTGTITSGCTATDNVMVTVQSPTIDAGKAQAICLGQCATLTATSGFASYSWSNGLTSNPIVVCPTATIIYTVTGTTTLGCTASNNVTIFVGQPPVTPIVSGQWTTCHTTTSDTIKNWNSNFTYYYYIGKNGDPQQITSNPFTVNWTGNTGGGMLYVEAVSNGCPPAIDSIKVFACCNYGEFHLCDQTISTSGTYSGSYDVNGQIIINANVTFGGTITSNFRMGPNAKIIINPGYTLTINHSSMLYAICDTMWDGIYITRNTAHLDVNANSSIRDAKNAIVSINGGDFQLSGSDTLRNNYKCVVVEPYAGTHTGKISQTIFTCNISPLLPQYPPVSSALSTRTHEGVEIDTVSKIFIGDTTAYSKRNTFNNVDYGINATGSQIYVYNNQFLNITKALLGTYAINITGGSIYSASAVVGKQNVSSYRFSNYFNNCFNGIYYTNTTLAAGTLNAKYDTMVVQNITHASPTGIYVNAGGVINTTMLYNRILNGSSSMGWGSGIYMQNFGANSSVNISSNNIQNITSGIVAAAAILTTPTGLFQVLNNTISYPNSYTNIQTGIQATNVQGNSTTGSYLYLAGNSVTFNTPSLTTMAYGIRVQNSSWADIEQNTVTNTATAPADSTSAKNFNGIQVELSPNAYLCGNNATKMGCGLRFVGTMPNSVIARNIMSSTYLGIRLDGANVGNQGTATQSNANQWLGTQNKRLQGTWSPIYWYYYGTTGSMTLYPIPTYVATNPPPTGWVLQATSYLSSCIVNAPQTLMSNTVQDVVNNQYVYTADVSENKYTDNTTAYTILKTNPALLSSLTQSNPKVQAFYNTADAGNIGQIYRINNLMLQHDYNDALALNNTLAPSNLMEQNRNAVNTVYLNTWANGRFIFTNDEYNTLYNIAVQNPVIAGNAVYSARVMLGIDGSNTVSSSNRMAENHPDNGTSPVVGKLYPNPVTNIANIDYTINSAKAELKVFSITGKEIVSYELNTNDTHFTFSTGQFNAGIYIYQLVANGEIISYNKFIIVK